jgi:hypothetical protein
MKLILLILGVVAVALNLFLWYSKRLARKTKSNESSRHKGKADGSDARSIKSLDNPEVASLKQSAAAELGISIEQLDRLSVEEIEELAARKDLI